MAKSTEITPREFNAVVYRNRRDAEIDTALLERCFEGVPYPYTITDKGSVKFTINHRSTLSMVRFRHNDSYRCYLEYKNDYGGKSRLDIGDFSQADIYWLSTLALAYGRIAEDVTATLAAMKAGAIALDGSRSPLKDTVRASYDSPQTYLLTRDLYPDRVLAMSVNPMESVDSAIGRFDAVYHRLWEHTFKLSDEEDGGARKAFRRLMSALTGNSNEVGVRRFFEICRVDKTSFQRFYAPPTLEPARPTTPGAPYVYPDVMQPVALNEGIYKQRFRAFSHTRVEDVRKLSEAIAEMGFNVGLARIVEDYSVLCVQLTADLFWGIYFSGSFFHMIPGTWSCGVFSPRKHFSLWDLHMSPDAFKPADVAYVFSLIASHMPYADVDRYRASDTFRSLLAEALLRAMPQGLYVDTATCDLAVKPSLDSDYPGTAMVFSCTKGFADAFSAVAANPEQLIDFMNVFAENPDCSIRRDNHRDTLSIVEKIFKSYVYGAPIADLGATVARELGATDFQYAVSGCDAVVRVSPEAVVRLVYQPALHGYLVEFEYTFDGNSISLPIVDQRTRIHPYVVERCLPIMVYLRTLSSVITEDLERIKKRLKQGEMVKTLVRPVLRALGCPNTKIEPLRDGSDRIRISKIIPGIGKLVADASLADYTEQARRFAEIYAAIDEIKAVDSDDRVIGFVDMVRYCVKRIGYYALNPDDLRGTTHVRGAWKPSIAVWAEHPVNHAGLMVEGSYDILSLVRNGDAFARYLELLNKYEGIKAGTSYYGFDGPSSYQY